MISRQPDSRNTGPSIWAVIPVKPLRESKSRLANVLSAEERAEMVYGILRHTLGVLRQTVGIARILVVSSDPDVLELAHQFGAMALEESEVRGLNIAVTCAVRLAAANQATAALILPADLPLIRVDDVERMLSGQADGAVNGSQDKPDVAICADARGEGTNALLVPLAADFTFHYGKGSFQSHLQEAKRLQLSSYIVKSPRLEFDLDTEEDWLKYQQVGDAQDQALDVADPTPDVKEGVSHVE